MEWGGDLGGPIVKDKLWFWASYVEQDIRLYRRQVRGIDRTILKTTNVKTNWQATSKDMISFLWFNGDKVKYGRGTGFAGIEARTATWNQGNFTNDDLPPGLFKIQDDRVFSSKFFMSAKYAYYNTGFTLDPIGGLEVQGGTKYAALPDLSAARWDNTSVGPNTPSTSTVSISFRRWAATTN